MASQRYGVYLLPAAARFMPHVTLKGFFRAAAWETLTWRPVASFLLANRRPPD